LRRMRAKFRWSLMRRIRKIKVEELYNGEIIEQGRGKNHE